MFGRNYVKVWVEVSVDLSCLLVGLWVKVDLILWLVNCFLCEGNSFDLGNFRLEDCRMMIFKSFHISLFHCMDGMACQSIRKRGFIWSNFLRATSMYVRVAFSLSLLLLRGRLLDRREVAALLASFFRRFLSDDSHWLLVHFYLRFLPWFIEEALGRCCSRLLYVFVTKGVLSQDSAACWAEIRLSVWELLEPFSWSSCVCEIVRMRVLVGHWVLYLFFFGQVLLLTQVLRMGCLSLVAHIHSLPSVSWVERELWFGEGLVVSIVRGVVCWGVRRELLL